MSSLFVVDFCYLDGLNEMSIMGGGGEIEIDFIFFGHQ